VGGCLDVGSAEGDEAASGAAGGDFDGETGNAISSPILPSHLHHHHHHHHCQKWWEKTLVLGLGPGQAVAPPENKYSNNSDVDRPIHGQSESLGKNISSFLSGRPVCLVLQKFTSGLSLSL
jgi:hypothetical protein